MLVEALIIAILIGYFRGGRLKNLTKLTIIGFWLVPLGLVAQLFVQWLAIIGINREYQWVSASLHLGSYVLLFVFLYLNRKIKGMPWLFIGVFLNAAVIAVNGGMMPVDSSYLNEVQITQLMRDGIHSVLTPETRIPLLADRFYLSLPLLGAQLFSIGDVLMDIGIIRMIIVTMGKR